jgi:crotonobetainyl-CoA:carnitine CoA-transferase CaiB-like acyl-CoA transferase
MQQAGEMTRFSGSPTPAKGGTDFPGPSAVRRVYQCRDGWIALSAQSQGETGLRRALGLSGGAEGGPRLDDLEQRFASATVEEALDDLAAASIAATRVVGRDEIFTEPSLAENCFFMSVRDTEHGPLTVIRGYGDWGPDEPTRRGWSHARGEDAAEILREAGLAADFASTGPSRA